MVMVSKGLSLKYRDTCLATVTGNGTNPRLTIRGPLYISPPSTFSQLCRTHNTRIRAWGSADFMASTGTRCVFVFLGPIPATPVLLGTGRGSDKHLVGFKDDPNPEARGPRASHLCSTVLITYVVSQGHLRAGRERAL